MDRQECPQSVHMSYDYMLIRHLRYPEGKGGASRQNTDSSYLVPSFAFKFQFLTIYTWPSKWIYRVYYLKL